MVGSLVSFGSFGDNVVLGSSFGSIGECGGLLMSLLFGLSGYVVCSVRLFDVRW